MKVKKVLCCLMALLMCLNCVPLGAIGEVFAFPEESEDSDPQELPEDVVFTADDIHLFFAGSTLLNNEEGFYYDYINDLVYVEESRNVAFEATCKDYNVVLHKDKGDYFKINGIDCDQAIQSYMGIYFTQLLLPDELKPVGTTVDLTSLTYELSYRGIVKTGTWGDIEKDEVSKIVVLEDIPENNYTIGASKFDNAITSLKDGVYYTTNEKSIDITFNKLYDDYEIQSVESIETYGDYANIDLESKSKEINPKKTSEYTIKDNVLTLNLDVGKEQMIFNIMVKDSSNHLIAINFRCIYGGIIPNNGITTISNVYLFNFVDCLNYSDNIHKCIIRNRETYVENLYYSSDIYFVYKLSVVNDEGIETTLINYPESEYPLYRDDLKKHKFFFNGDGTIVVYYKNMITGEIKSSKGSFYYYCLDEDSPVISNETLNSQDIGSYNSWIRNDVKDMTYSYNVKDCNFGSEAYSKVYINGVLCLDEVTKSWQEDHSVLCSFKMGDVLSALEKNNAIPEDGIYNLRIEASDGSNPVTVSEHTLKIELDDPVITYMSSSSTPNEKDGVLYTNKDIVIGEDYSIPCVSGVNKIWVTKEGSSDILADGLPYTISESGRYVIHVASNADVSEDGTIKTSFNFPLGYVCWNKDVNSNQIIFDNVKPVISRASGFDGDLEKEGITWYKEDTSLVYNISDNIGLDNITFEYTGEDGSRTLTPTVTGSSYTINISDKMKGVITATAVDYAGNKTSDTFSIGVDSDSPSEITSDVSNNYEKYSDFVYFRSNPVFSFSYEDTGIGVKSYIVRNNGNTYTQDNGVFEGKGLSGSATLEVIDELGNSTGEIPFKDIFGDSFKDIRVDFSKPLIELKNGLDGSTLWYAKDQSFSLNFKDTVGIKEAKISINGNVVSSYKFNSVIEDTITLLGNTEGIISEDNSYSISAEVVDMGGNVTTWSKVIYIDKDSPIIKEVKFSGDGSINGNPITTNGEYGFYFTGKAECKVTVSDGKNSSGLSNLHVTFNNNGKVSEKDIDISKGMSSISIPKNFNGFISFYAVDNVGNKSKVINPDGIVVSENVTNISISMPKTDFKDINGVPLYSSVIKAVAKVDNSALGVKEVSWGISDKTLGTVLVDKDGNITGDVDIVSSKRKNIVINLSKVITTGEDISGASIWVSVTDNTGRVVKDSSLFSIDTVFPMINVSYTSNNSNNYYSSDRVANVEVNDVNLDVNTLSIQGVTGNIGEWSKEGNTWKTTIVFNEDKDYGYSLNIKDLANNDSNTYSSEKFTIDKTKPVINVSWNNNNVQNGKYYSSSRVATVSIVEHNFDSSLVKVNDNSINWSSNGDTHVGVISFNTDGDYKLSVSGSDKAGNVLNSYSSEDFTIDIIKPEVSVSGVQSGVSYKKDVYVSVGISDKFLDSSRTSVELVGRKNGKVDLTKSVGTQSGTYSLSVPDDVKYDDYYTLSVKAYDLAGNYSEETMSFSVNRHGSYYTQGSGEKGNKDIVVNKAESVVLRESNVDEIDTDKVKIVVYRNSTKIEVPKDKISISYKGIIDGLHTYEYTIDKDVFGDDGKYIIQIFSSTVNDSENSSLSEEYSFMLDTSSPDIIISGVEDNGSYKEYSREVTLDIRDQSGLSSLSVYVNGSELPKDKLSYDDVNGLYSFEMLEDSSYQNIKIVATDNAENTSEVTVGNILITANTFVYIINQTWVKIMLIALAGIIFVGAIVVVIIKGKKK